MTESAPFYRDSPWLPERGDLVRVVFVDGTEIETVVDETRTAGTDNYISMVPVDVAVTEAEAILRDQA